MRPFGYVFDPLFLVCCALYAANRWLIKPHCHIVFFHAWFNDLWLIPCALPPLLLAHRWLGLRRHDDPPTVGEIAAHLVGWSVLFEVIGPHIMRTTGDPKDAAAYAFGAGVGLIWWRGPALLSRKGGGGFDWMAPYYRWMERILAGRKLQRCRTAYLNRIPAPKRVLIIGVGHGRFLPELLQAHPGASCVCLDASAEMLKAARANLRASGLDESRVAFVQADLGTWQPPKDSYDLIVSHFVFDCFTNEQLAGIVGRLTAAAAPNARWLVADFRCPEKGPERWRAQAILGAMYLFFRWATGITASQLPKPEPIMKNNGFELRERRIFEWGLLQSDLWQRGRPDMPLNAAVAGVC